MTYLVLVIPPDVLESLFIVCSMAMSQATDENPWLLCRCTVHCWERSSTAPTV